MSFEAPSSYLSSSRCLSSPGSSFPNSSIEMQMQPPVPNKEQVLGALLASYLLWSSIICAVVAFLASIVVEHLIRKTNGGAEVHFNRAASAITVPSGLLLLYCATNPAVFQYVPGLNFALALAALIFLYVVVKTTMK